MPNKIFSEDTLDRNGLNVNDYEVKMVKKFYDKCNKYLFKFCYYVNRKNEGSGIFRINMQNLLETQHLTLLENLFSIYDYSQVDYNNFFQFVVFFSFAPMVSVFYFILHGLNNVTDQIAWVDILKITSSLDSTDKVDQSVINLFKKYDMNKDGSLSFNQFCNFTAQTVVLFDPLFIFREKLVNCVFPDCRYRIMLLRREYINDINEYVKSHSNKFPIYIIPQVEEPQQSQQQQLHQLIQQQQMTRQCSCLRSLLNEIRGIPPDSKYDYSVENIESLSMSEFVYYMIKKYNKQYVYNKELFAMKYLNIYNQYPIIYEIDQFYVRFKAALPKKKIPSLKLSNPFDTNSSEFSQKNSTHSILRESKKTTSSYNNRISLSSSRKCSNQAQQPIYCTSLMTLSRIHKYSLQSTPQSKKSLPPLKISHRSANSNLRVPFPSTPFNLNIENAIPETPFS